MFSGLSRSTTEHELPTLPALNNHNSKYYCSSVAICRSKIYIMGGDNDKNIYSFDYIRSGTSWNIEGTMLRLWTGSQVRLRKFDINMVLRCSTAVYKDQIIVVGFKTEYHGLYNTDIGEIYNTRLRFSTPVEWTYPSCLKNKLTRPLKF